MRLLVWPARESRHVTNLFFSIAAILVALSPLHSNAAGVIAVGSSVTLIATADGSPAPTFQWRKNGTEIEGATTQTLSFSAVTAADAAVYQVVASNEFGAAVSQEETLAVDTTATGTDTPPTTLPEPRDDDSFEPIGVDTDAPVSGLVNLSVRATAGVGAKGLIVGFVIDGSSSKSVLVRGVGPTLRDFGVIGALSDPQLALYSGALMRAGNDDWSANANVADIVRTSLRVGAFSLADRTSDSALMATLKNGAYTVQLSGKGSSSGIALVEVYDAASSELNKLVNLSVRAYVGGGSDVPNVGFVVAGNAARNVMIRAAGPALAAFGVPDSISDPELELFRGSTWLDRNDNWGGGATLITTFAKVGAFAFADKTSHDAVLLTTLPPGAYTAVVKGVNGSKGTALVEVYDVP